jgi:hypothetical protein
MKYILSMAALTAATALPVTAAPTILYDGAQPGTPDTQGWLRVDPDSSMQTAAAGHTNINTTNDPGNLTFYSNQDLDTSATPETGTFVNPAFPILNRFSGYSISFTGTMNSESHDPGGSSPYEDDAGWTLLAISNDLQGIQIGIRNNELFTLSAGLQEQNNVAFDNTGTHTYTLNVHGSNFSLDVDGFQKLSGNTVDASGNGYFYELPNYLLLGDVSLGADVNYDLASVSVNIPEPFMLCPLVLGLAVLTHRRRRTR